MPRRHPETVASRVVAAVTLLLPAAGLAGWWCSRSSPSRCRIKGDPVALTGTLVTRTSTGLAGFA